MSKENSQKTDFTSKWQFADIEFRVEDKLVYANKTILSMWSPVFRAMFSASFIEQHAKEVVLPGKKYDDVVHLMQVLHPPCKEIEDSNVEQLLPLIHEYQIEALQEKVEEFLCNQAASIKNYLLSQQFNLPKLQDYCLQFLKRVPYNRLKQQPQYDQLEQPFLLQLMAEKLEKFENSVENLREVRMVLERKKPTTFPGMALLCEQCNIARDQQVDCVCCLNSCCNRLSSILRSMDS